MPAFGTTTGYRRSVRGLVASALSIVFLIGCSGGAGPGQPADGFGQLDLPDEPAVWAVRAIEPCALLEPVRSAGLALGPAYPNAPHSCAAPLSAGDQATNRVVVRVGSVFDTVDRAFSAPVVLGGRSAYQRLDVPGVRPADRYTTPRCSVYIPLSPASAVEIEAPAGGVEVAVGCATARAAAERIGPALATPAALTGAAPPTALRRWHACDLLETAIAGILVNRADSIGVMGAAGHAGANSCRGTPREQNGATYEMRLAAAADPAASRTSTGKQLVTLSFAQAEQNDLGTSCELGFAAEAVPGAPPERAVHRLDLRVSGAASGGCAAAIDAAERINRALLGSPPQLPATPTTLGFTPDQPDNELPAACGIFAGPRPDQCRWPHSAEPARGAQAVLDADGAADAPDRACAVLRDALARLPLKPDIDYAASRTGACYALSVEGYTVTLDFFPAGPATEYCRLGSLRREPVVVAGRAGFECQPRESSRHLILPAFAGAADQPGVLLIDGTLREPRGLRLSDRPRDRSMVTTLTDQIAEHVIVNYLG